MKYIVLYLLATSIFFATEAWGQKPFIDLLPSRNESHYRQRVIDTSNNVQPGSEIHFRVSDYSPLTDSSQVIDDRTLKMEESPVKKPIHLYRLIFPIKFMILDITAYKP
jgi:hypothetical protein